MRLSLLTLALALFGPFSLAVTGPDAIHYQGVLRDASDSPQDGAFDMRFRFFDAETGGNEILVDAHLASGTGAVDVSGGLFAVALGSGAVSDGSGPGTYTSLALVFASFPNVWLEIDVEGEALSPRAPLFASPYAHNATYLDGRASSGYINTTSEAQTKSGTLTLGALSVNNLVTIKGGSPGEGRVLTSNATGTARWETPPVTAEAAALGSLADRLRSTDPAALPFATLRPFDCSRTPATLTFAADGTTLGSVVGFLGTERISAPFEFLVSLESATPITTAAQVGRIGKVTIARDTGTTTYSGRITEFSAAGFDPGARTYLYVARLEPRIGDLARRSGYSVRQSETILETIDAKLAAAGVTSRQFITSGIFPVLDMTIQYDESELAFVSRLAENDGVHFHFREIAGGDEVVFGDANSVFPAIARPLSYVGDQADPGDGSEYVATFLQRQRTFSGTGRVRGYRVESPATPTDAASTATAARARSTSTSPRTSAARARRIARSRSSIATRHAASNTPAAATRPVCAPVVSSRSTIRRVPAWAARTSSRRRSTSLCAARTSSASCTATSSRRFPTP
ncbi:MAG: hypothetical protein HC882_06155 [Acidobacteria bacterium]|nr:hypothetical protein [Acidobacteriota bacterium]